MFLLFFNCYITLPVGGVLHDLKFRRVTQAFYKTIMKKKKKKRKNEFTFKQHFHTAIAVVLSGLHWRRPFDFSGMERGSNHIGSPCRPGFAFPCEFDIFQTGPVPRGTTLACIISLCTQYREARWPHG